MTLTPNINSMAVRGARPGSSNDAAVGARPGSSNDAAVGAGDSRVASSCAFPTPYAKCPRADAQPAISAASARPVPVHMTTSYTQTTSLAKPCASYTIRNNRNIFESEPRVIIPQTMRNPRTTHGEWNVPIYGGSLPVPMHLEPQVKVARRPCSYGDVPQTDEATEEELKAFSRALQQWALVSTKMEVVE